MKKFLLLLVAVLALVGLTACDEKPSDDNKDDDQPQANPLAGTYDFTMWVSDTEGVKELFEAQIDAFEAANEGITLNATVSAVGEGDSATQMLTDLETGADLYCFAQDQLARLVQAGALTPLGAKASETVRAENNATSIAAASVSGNLYCYPLTADNCYFMYYDKSVIQESSVDSLEAIIADCEAANQKFSFNLGGSGWYNASFFFATGCKSDWFTNEDGDITSVEDTFNSPAGIVALRGMQKLLKSNCYVDSGEITDLNAASKSAVVISGTWNSKPAKDILGDNFGVADLPSFTVDGETYDLTSFMGCKLLGLKPQKDAKKAAVLQQLALYLSGEKCQLERHAGFGWGPSNLKAQQSEAVLNDDVIAAVAQQAEKSVVQRAIDGAWWDISKTYVAAALAADLDDTAALQAALDNYKTAIEDIFKLTPEQKRSWTVIGVVKGTNWDTDFAMTESPEGVWTSNEAFEFAAGTEFKVRKSLKWDESYGANGGNFIVETAGTYYVKFTVATQTVELIPAE